MPENMIGLAPAQQSRYSLARKLLDDSMQYRPVQTHLQGLGQLAKSLSGAYQLNELDQERQGNLDSIVAAASGPDGWRNPELARLLMEGGDLGAGLGIAQASSQYDLDAADRANDAQLMDMISGQTQDPFILAAARDDPSAALSMLRDDRNSTPVPYGGPRGLRNNNPLNLRHSSSAWQGMAPEQTDDEFVQFETAADGVRAAALNLRTYAERGVATVGEALSIWAPVGDGNNDPQAYAEAVERYTGITPETPLDVMDSHFMATLLGGMAAVENGGPVDSSVIQQGVAAAFGQATAPPVPLVSEGSAPAQAGQQVQALTPPVGAAADPRTGMVEPVTMGDQQFWPMMDGSFQPLPTPDQQPYGDVSGMAGENARILLQGDPSSAEYAYAYAQEFQTPRYVQTDRGTVAVMNPVPPGIAPPINPIAPLPEQTPGQPTVGAPLPGTANYNDMQVLSAGFARTMGQANDVLSGLENSGYDPAGVETGALELVDSLIPFGNYALPEEYQRYDQAKRAFINAQLRRESGAAISEAEFENANQQYFPAPGDSPEVIAQKANNRALAIQNMIGNSGGAFDESQSVASPSTPVLRYERDENGILRRAE